MQRSTEREVHDIDLSRHCCCCLLREATSEAFTAYYQLVEDYLCCHPFAGDFRCKTKLSTVFGSCRRLFISHNSVLLPPTSHRPLSMLSRQNVLIVTRQCAHEARKSELELPAYPVATSNLLKRPPTLSSFTDATVALA